MSDAPLLTDAERIKLAQEDFGFFLGWVHETDARDVFGGKAVPAAHHLEMIDLLTEETGHTLIVAPRQSAKTTVVAGWIEWGLGRASLSDNKNWANDHRVLWFSNTAHQAYRPSNAIRATIEANPIYHAIFPKVLPHKDKWSQEEWKVKGNNIKDANFLALGVQGPALGARGLIIVYDDIADQDNMKTPRSREDLIEWLDTTAAPIIVPWGRFVMACTRWAWDDPADWAEKRHWTTLATHPMKALIEEGTESDGITLDGLRGGTSVGDTAQPGGDAVVSRLVRGIHPIASEANNVAAEDVRPDTESAGGNAGALTADRAEAAGIPAGTADSAITYRSYWPERFSVEYLRGLQAENPRAFAKTHQNEVAPEEGLVFERIWFEDRFDTPPGEIIFRVDSWDTAAGQGRKRSYSVGLSALVSRDFHLYLVNMLRGQLPYPDLKASIRMTARRNKSNVIIIEAKSSGQQALQELRLEGLPVVEFQPFGQKGSPSRQEGNVRISDICAQRRVHLPSDYYCRRAGSLGWLPDWEREVFSYPDGENDDIVDALCQMLWWVEEQRLRHIKFMRAPQDPTPWGVSYRPEDVKALV